MLDRHAESDDTINTVEIRRIAIGDGTKLGVDEIIAHLHDVAALISLEMCIVRVTQQEHLFGNLRTKGMHASESRRMLQVPPAKDFVPTTRKLLLFCGLNTVLLPG